MIKPYPAIMSPEKGKAAANERLLYEYGLRCPMCRKANVKSAGLTPVLEVLAYLGNKK
jgi:hypothetical protein